MTFQLLKHQKASIEFMKQNPRSWNASSPGTGKTCTILGYLLENNLRALILAPMSLLEAAWYNDLRKMGAEEAAVIALAKNRAKAFAREAPITIANIEALNWMARKENAHWSSSFDFVCVDEVNSLRNSGTQRSKNAAPVFARTERACVMSGTPMVKTCESVFYPTKLLDKGARLGTSVTRFRWAYRTGTPIPGAPAGVLKWIDKPDAKETVAGLISDITVRYSLEEVEEIPKNSIHWVMYSPRKEVMDAYKTMIKSAVAKLKDGTLLVGVNAAVARGKALQILTENVFDNHGAMARVGGSRAKLVVDLIEERAHSVVFFIWKHQRAAMTEELDKRKITYAVIDGSVPGAARGRIVQDFQEGKYQTILMHPETGAHGLTLTRARAVIFTTPPGDRPDWLEQGIARIRRKGQTEKTETLLVCAENTFERRTYQKILDEADAGTEFLAYLQELVNL